MATALQSDSQPRTIDRGLQSRIGVERQVVVRDVLEWRALWQQHAPDRAQPSIDFSVEMVIGLFLGARNSGGYAIEVVSARRQGEGTVVRYRQREPARGAITAQVMTSAYHVVSIPRSSGNVRFERVE